MTLQHYALGNSVPSWEGGLPNLIIAVACMAAKLFSGTALGLPSLYAK